MTGSGRIQGARRLAFQWALAGLAIQLVPVVLFLARARGNPEWFVHFGRQSAAIARARAVLGPDLLVPHSDGHDGQSFWVLARDPLLTHAADVRSSLDDPSYRAQRIAYPALASPWALGGERALIWGLLIVNLAAAFGGAYVATRLAQDLGAPARASLAFSFCPGVLIAVLMDLADALALAALLATLLLVYRRRASAAVVAAVLAVLTKESALLSLAGVALLARDVRPRARAALVVVPGVAAAVWALYVRVRLGWPPHTVQAFAPPFQGFVRAWELDWGRTRSWADAAIAAACLPLAIVIVRRWWAQRDALMSAALPLACLTPFLSEFVLDLPTSSLRYAAPMMTLLALDVYRGGARYSIGNADTVACEVARDAVAPGLNAADATPRRRP